MSNRHRRAFARRLASCEEGPDDVEQAILVTGGSGFIGSNFALQWIERESARIVNLDKLTYAGNPHNLERIASHPRYRFVHGDIADRELVKRLLRDHRPRAIVISRPRAMWIGPSLARMTSSGQT